MLHLWNVRKRSEKNVQRHPNDIAHVGGVSRDRHLYWPPFAQAVLFRSTLKTSRLDIIQGRGLNQILQCKTVYKCDQILKNQ